EDPAGSRKEPPASPDAATRATTAPAPNSDVLEVASGGGNVWVVTRDPIVVGRWRLLHHHTGMEGQHARISRALQSRPIAIAARDDEVLVAMPSSPVPGKEIDLLSLTVQQDPTMGNFYELPLDSWKVLANIPSDRPFKGLALGPAGPQVLLGPPETDSGGKRTVEATEGESAPPTARLLEQRAFTWHERPLPEVLLRASDLRLLPSVGTTEVTILARGDSGTARLHQCSEDVWSTFDLGIDFADVDRVCQTATRLGFAARGSKASRLELGVLRGEDLLDVASVDRPARAWGLGAVEEDLLVIVTWDPQDEAGRGAVLVSRVDAVNGTVESPVAWTRLPLDVSDWLQLPLIGMLMVVALLAIVLFRPTEDPRLPLQNGVVPMPMGRRLLALLLDLSPGFVLAALLFKAPFSGASPLSIWTSEVALSAPGSLVIGVTLLHEAVSELIWGRSLGKLVFGGVVRSSTGARPTSGAILLRALFKGVVLYAPVLGVFAFISPARQGIPETVSRTVVADRLARSNPPEA
ncbi:MAG: RDD family protein, partial [Planctomycetota bacterium]|nr:RDD family protein [Planctomycetota bacterium]